MRRAQLVALLFAASCVVAAVAAGEDMYEDDEYNPAEAKYYGATGSHKHGHTGRHGSHTGKHSSRTGHTGGHKRHGSYGSTGAYGGSDYYEEYHSGEYSGTGMPYENEYETTTHYPGKHSKMNIPAGPPACDANFAGIPACVNKTTGRSVNQNTGTCRVTAQQWCANTTNLIPHSGKHGKVWGTMAPDQYCCCFDYLPLGTTCRAAAGSCDNPEVCPGPGFSNSASCPNDSFKPNTVPCTNVTAGECIANANCPGNGPACPGPRFLNQGRPCTPANGGGRRLTQAGTAKHKEVVHGTTTCPRCYLGHCVNFRWEWWKEIKNGTKMYKHSHGMDYTPHPPTGYNPANFCT